MKHNLSRMKTPVTENSARHKHRYIVGTKSTDTGMGKRVWKRDLEEYEFEGYTDDEISSLERDDMMDFFASDRKEDKMRHELSLSPAKAFFGAEVKTIMKEKAARSLVRARYPSFVTAFLAIGAVVATGLVMVGFSDRVSGIAGVTVSAIICVVVYYIRPYRRGTNRG